jgi:hypothetical protein
LPQTDQILRLPVLFVAHTFLQSPESGVGETLSIPTAASHARLPEAHIAKASTRCPSLRSRAISPHTVRHATAMHLLQSGVDITVIAMWLGHEDTATTHQYIEADLAMKEAALKRMDPPSSKPARFKAGDRLLAFLEAL